MHPEPLILPRGVRYPRLDEIPGGAPSDAATRVAEAHRTPVTTGYVRHERPGAHGYSTVLEANGWRTAAMDRLRRSRRNLAGTVCVRRILAYLLRPLFVWTLRRSTWERWERLAHGIPYWRFASGSRHDFRWYFEGASSVTVTSVDEICDWLLACDCGLDPDLFNEADFWQHPRTFEQLRRGDCEDHALWAWRKLVELGIRAVSYFAVDGQFRTVAFGGYMEYLKSAWAKKTPRSAQLTESFRWH